MRNTRGAENVLNKSIVNPAMKLILKYVAEENHEYKKS